MTSARVEHVISTSSPWESIWSTRCHPMHSRGPSPGSIQHRPSRRPHSGAKASGTRQCLSPGRVVAVPGKKMGTRFTSWQLQFRCLCLDGWRTLSNATISGSAHVCQQRNTKRQECGQTAQPQPLSALLPVNQLPCFVSDCYYADRITDLRRPKIATVVWKSVSSWSALKAQTSVPSFHCADKCILIMCYRCAGKGCHLEEKLFALQETGFSDKHK